MHSLHPEELKRLYLSFFPFPQRSGAANHVLGAVRAGCNEPNQVVGYCLECARQKLPYSEVARLYLLVYQLDPDAIYAGARWALWWESLSPAEKAAYRKPRQEAAQKAWMEQQPATEKQIAYLRFLGYSGPTPANRAEASRLIETLKGVHHG